MLVKLLVETSSTINFILVVRVCNSDASMSSFESSTGEVNSWGYDENSNIAIAG